MASNEFTPQTDETPLETIQEKLHRQLKHAKREHAGQFYVPLGEVERILHKSSLQSLIQHSNPGENEDVQKAVRLLLQRQPKSDLAEYRFLRSFATLLYCDNAQYTELAIRYFLHCSSCEKEESKCKLEEGFLWKPPEDKALPSDYSDSSSLKKAFYGNLGNPRDGFCYQFFDQKRFFCALVLKEGGRHKVRGDVVLPFFIDERNDLGKGAAGRVYQVAVGRRQWVDKRLSNSEDILLAVKQFKPPPTEKGKDRFAIEFQNLTKLMNASIKSQNVMLPLASLIHGEVRYLIYDLAETTLDKYMWASEPRYVFNAETAKGVLKNGTDLVGALYWIHKYKPYHTIVHGDIRPENILILRESSREIWKLADFDRALARSTSSNESGAAMKQNWQSYHPPESKSGRRNDVWSMACMITLILSWLSGGPEAIGEFVEMRNQKDPAKPDFFYKEENPGSLDILNPGVKEWLERLRNRARAQAMAVSGEINDLAWYPNYVEEVTKYLSDKVFVPRENRDHAEPFYAAMEKSYSEIYNTDYVDLQLSDENETFSRSPISSTESLVSELPTRRSSMTFLRGRTNSLRRSGSQGRRTPRESPSRLAVPQRPTTTLTAPQPETMAYRVASDMTLHVPDLISTPVPKRCTELCSAIGRGPPPDDISAYAQDINRLCPNCDDVPIHKAIRRGSREWVLKLLAIDGINLEKECSLGETHTPLKRCCMEDQPWAAKLLLEANCLLNIDRKFIESIKAYDTRREIKEYIDEEKKRRMRR